MPDLFEQHRLLITRERFLLIEGKMQDVDGVLTVRAEIIRQLVVAAVETSSHDFHSVHTGLPIGVIWSDPISPSGLVLTSQFVGGDFLRPTTVNLKTGGLNSGTASRLTTISARPGPTDERRTAMPCPFE